MDTPDATERQDDLTPNATNAQTAQKSRLGSLTDELTAKAPMLGKELGNALKVLAVLIVLCGGVFPLVIFGLGQVAFPHQANGSLITDGSGQVVGSQLLGQQFTQPIYFHGRPSAVGYNAANSGAANLGPTNPQLLDGNGTLVIVSAGTPIPAGATPVSGQPHTYLVPGSYLGVRTYAQQFRQENGLPADYPLPADIVTASGSGLDPDISVAAAYLQANRIAAARHALGGKRATITGQQVQALIAQHITDRDIGVLGEPRVNVLQLNLALDAMYGK